MKMNLKNSLVLIVFTVCIASVSFGITESNPNKNSFNELTIRGGLPNFFSKALIGDSIKVAYLGGSITAQNGWRVLSLEWFKKQYPKGKFTEINAAIGGTGSDFGVFRLNDHVLKFKPDLVFVEFTVNDGGTPEEKIIRSMEGIVRQIWQQNPKTDICFVYTLKDSFLEPAKLGQLPTSALTMEKVADHYKIPSVNFAVIVSKMVFANQIIFKDASKEMNKIAFSPDGVHPYPETGHVIYQGAIARSFETMGAGNRFKRIKHKMPKPIAKDYFSNTKMLNLNQVQLSKNWQILKIKDQPGFTGFGKYLEEFGKASQTGETLSLNFKGKAIGAYDIMGPDAGKVIVQIDGVVKDTISRFDAYCTYRRMNYFLIDHLEDKEHVVVFKVLAEPFDKAAILQKRNETMKNSADFIENNWYIGKILLDGVLNHFK